MIVGIVGSEAAKFTEQGECLARAYIRNLLCGQGDDCGIELINITEVVSGECHLGGIDIWARQTAHEMSIPFTGFAPKVRNWSQGYMPRNLQIAERSDVVVCITVDQLPQAFTGMRFDYCYHCKTKEHVKSGGCWTRLQAEKMGKIGWTYVVANY